MYAELKCRTNFSFLRGASDSREYVARASELRIPAIAITDLHGVYALPRAYEACKMLPEVKLIAGAEFKISGHPNITLLARDRPAYGALCRLITTAHADKPKGEAILTLTEFFDALGLPGATGLLALPEDGEGLTLGPMKDLFGGDRLSIPLCLYDDGLDERRIEQALYRSKRFQIPIVAHNDVHFHHPNRKRVQDCFTCIREGVTLPTAGVHLHGNAERYLKSPLQMRAQFNEFPDAIRRTTEISESCTFKLSELTYTYPKELTPPGLTPQSYLEELVLQGAHRIYRGSVPNDVAEQIEHELKLIHKLGYASYFLTIADIVSFARSKDILCQGRGSAANSVSCYCLGITSIDPVRMGLLFERFISEERSEPPDIDVDFEHERREEVLQYVYQRYGRNHAGMVAAIRTYQKKSAFLEIAKAIGIPLGTMSADALALNFEKIAGPGHERKRALIDELVSEIEDMPRHLSIHSGGFTLSADPIIETVPIEPARMEGRTIIQWDKNDLDTVGLLKVDLLSIGLLSVIQKTCAMIGLAYVDIPAEDAETYAMIQRAETEGTFQIESRAQKSMLPRSRPQNFYDLVVQVALVRPGPSVGQMVNPYLDRRSKARNGIPYKMDDPELESILGRTFGVPIFQEQVMRLAITKAGFSPGEADQLRRAIAAWRDSKSVEALVGRLKDGLVKHGMLSSKADEFVSHFRGFAAYNFPESHAASYALVAYRSAYLKRHHPAEFLCSLINSQPMGFYPIDVLIGEAKRNGVKVLPVDPNLSEWDAVLEAFGTVRMGFKNVRRIREEDVNWMTKENERQLTESDFKGQVTELELKSVTAVLTAERKKRPFTNLFDFTHRTRFKREVIEALAMADVFEAFGLDQRHTYWRSIQYQALLEGQDAQQLSLFQTQPGAMSEVSSGDGSGNGAGETAMFAPMTKYEAIFSDFQLLGYSLKGHPMAALREEEQALPQITSREIKALPHRARVRYAGLMSVMQSPPTAKGVCFVTYEDESGLLDTILKKEEHERFKPILRTSRFLLIEGVVQKQDGRFSVLVDYVEPIHRKAESTVSQPVRHGQHPREIGGSRGL